MPVKSPSHITVALPEGAAPSQEATDILIKRFLKACKKENIAGNVFEKSHLVKRFERPAEIERQRKIRAKRKALRDYADAEKKDADTKQPRKTRNNNNKNVTENRNG